LSKPICLGKYLISPIACSDVAFASAATSNFPKLQQQLVKVTSSQSKKHKNYKTLVTLTAVEVFLLHHREQYVKWRKLALRNKRRPAAFTESALRLQNQIIAGN